MTPLLKTESDREVRQHVAPRAEGHQHNPPAAWCRVQLGWWHSHPPWRDFCFPGFPREKTGVQMSHYLVENSFPRDVA